LRVLEFSARACWERLPWLGFRHQPGVGFVVGIGETHLENDALGAAAPRSTKL